MFHHMMSAWIWASIFAAFMIVCGALADGRGLHTARILLGLTPRPPLLDLYVGIAKQGSDWRLIEQLDEDYIGRDDADRDDDLPRRASEPSLRFRMLDEQPQQPVPPRTMPPSITPRSRESLTKAG